jgi:hypothetical protein
MNGVCKKCTHRKSCKTPCRPVELHLVKDNLTVYEKSSNKNQIILFPRSREIREAELTGKLKRGDEEAEHIFNTDAENPFAEFEPNFKKTSVFIKRFFLKWEYSDIAQAHDISVSAAYKIYHYSVQRLLSVIMEMDQVRKSMSPEDQKKSAVKKQKKYLDCNRGKVNERRRKHYEKNKERINTKRRTLYKGKKESFF